MFMGISKAIGSSDNTPPGSGGVFFRNEVAAPVGGCPAGAAGFERLTPLPGG